MRSTLTAAGLGRLLLTAPAVAEPDGVELVEREGRAHAVDSGEHLRRYVGLSNVKDDEGGLEDARIVFGPRRVRAGVAAVPRSAGSGSQ